MSVHDRQTGNKEMTRKNFVDNEIQNRVVRPKHPQ